MPQPRGLHTVDARQHSGRRLDQKLNFSKAGNDPIQALTCIDTGRKYAQVFLDAVMKGFKQWFAGKRNNVADALSQEWQRTNKTLNSILRSHFPNQMPDHFEILQIPSKISCWLISLLQQLPVSKRLREEHTTAKLEHGNVGQHTASPSDAPWLENLLVIPRNSTINPFRTF